MKDIFLSDVLAGLRADPKVLPCKYFYDDAGSRLFDQICELPEYYPTRAELAIMENHVGEIAGAIGPAATVIEYGSGSSMKTRQLLDRLTSPAAYVPVEISGEYLAGVAVDLRTQYPGLEILPVAADFTKPFSLPRPAAESRRKVVYFPGSTIGNFNPPECEKLLRGIAELVGPDGGVVLGMDVRKDVPTMEAAYNDAAGVTAAFNLNILHHINRELNAEFDVDAFRHQAIFNRQLSCIEMFLFSERDQKGRVGGEEFAFAAGEPIRTERSYKYDLKEFAEFAPRAGLRVEKVWQDPQQLFSVQYLVRR